MQMHTLCIRECGGAMGCRSGMGAYEAGRGKKHSILTTKS